MTLLQIFWKELPLPYLISESGDVISLHQKTLFHVLHPEVDKDGYFKVRLAIKKNKYKKFFVHRLVCGMFCSGYKPGLVVNHKDGNKQNNHYTNLEWVTSQENEDHASKNFLKANGTRNCFCVYSDDIVHKICRAIDKGRHTQNIADKYGVPYFYVYQIKKGQLRREISKDYNFASKFND